MTERTFDFCVIVDDDPDILLAARLLLRERFAKVSTYEDPDAALTSIAGQTPDVILLDANFGRGATDAAEGLNWLGRFLEQDPEAAIVMITAHGGLQIAIEAMKRGAADFVTKPWSNERLLATVSSAATLRQSRREVSSERRKSAEISITPETPLLSRSATMERVLEMIERAAPTDANVLILGENGTGKELVARELHRRSLRAPSAMLSVDLGAIAENVIDSELFGHVKGAFTDAKGDRIGRFAAAEGGTLFLDEIGNLPLHLQPKLLSALEQRQVTPVGANKAIPVDVRVIAATNLSRDELADQGRFRQDLLFRLNTLEIALPPLRERREDIPLLLDHYLALYARKYSRSCQHLSTEVVEALTAYDWPGNVRALRHAVERAVILSGDSPITLDDFSIRQHAKLPVADTSQDLSLEQMECRVVEQALRRHAYNISKAAAALGLSRGALYRRMERHGL